MIFSGEAQRRNGISNELLRKSALPVGPLEAASGQLPEPRWDWLPEDTTHSMAPTLHRH